MNFKNKKITIMGLGLHGGGLGIAKWLAEQGAILTVTDLKTKKELAVSLKKLKKFKRIKYILGRHQAGDFQKADLIIKNPGIFNNSPYLTAAQQAGVPIETDIGLFFNFCPAPIIGITGTRGKSTTTALIGEMFKAIDRKTMVAGNIRRSPFDNLKKLTARTPVVLELSSWQLEGLKSVKKSPHLAIITNVMKDHLNRYAGMKGYIAAKKLIFQYQNPKDFAILNKNNKITAQLGKTITARRYWFSKKYFTEENGSFVRNGQIFFRQYGKESPIIKVADLFLKGEHNLENVLAAVTAAKICNLPQSKIIKALKSFKGLPDRQELIAVKKGISYYNDTTATTPDGVMAALKLLGPPAGGKKKMILIAGGTDKKLDFKDLGKMIPQKVKALVLLEGTATDKLLKKIEPRRRRGETPHLTRCVGKKMLPIARVDSMASAVKTANNFAVKGDIVLLSPGGASFGLFVNEFDRGEQFRKEVLSFWRERSDR
ncbi:MAG: UDP-N-acetylmuramoyl-L-alanine--D-glutamate ligase [bacterium]